MVKIGYINENTFESTDHYVEDFHYKLAEQIQKHLLEKLMTDSPLSPMVSNIFVDETGKKLKIGVMEERQELEDMDEYYEITIKRRKRI